MLKPRKSLDKKALKEDKLLTLTAKIQDQLTRNWKPTLYAVLAVAALFGGYKYFDWSRKAKEGEAALMQLRARATYQNGNADEAMILLDSVLTEYSGTSSTDEALFLKGRIFQERGDFPQAEETFKKVISKVEDQYLGFAACYGMGTMAAGQKNYEEAARHFKAAATRFPRHFNAPVALVEAGECLRKISKYEEAKEMYKKVMKDYPKARAADDARNNLAELEFMG